jgi:hypothetical protein
MRQRRESDRIRWPLLYPPVEHDPYYVAGFFLAKYKGDYARVAAAIPFSIAGMVGGRATGDELKAWFESEYERHKPVAS